MKKFLEEVIEIVLDNVSCEHEVDVDDYGLKQHYTTYSLDNEQVVIKKCLAAIPARLIEKPLLTETLMKRKVLEMMINFNTKGKFYDDKEKGCREILDSLVNELAVKINLKGD